MTPNTLLDNEYGMLLCHPDKGIIHHAFRQPISGPALREALNDEDYEWSTTEWFPRVKEAGWEFWTLVVPADFAGRLEMTGGVEKYYKLGANVRVFPRLQPALEWLEQL